MMKLSRRRKSINNARRWVSSKMTQESAGWLITLKRTAVTTLTSWTWRLLWRVLVLVLTKTSNSWSASWLLIFSSQISQNSKKLSRISLINAKTTSREIQQITFLNLPKVPEETGVSQYAQFRVKESISVSIRHLSPFSPAVSPWVTLTLLSTLDLKPCISTSVTSQVESSSMPSSWTRKACLIIHLSILEP